MISKEKFINTYIIMYFLMVLTVSYTAFNSPFIAQNYTLLILWNSLILLASSYYLIGFKYTKIWWKDNMKKYKKRYEMRKIINKEINKRVG